MVEWNADLATQLPAPLPASPKSDEPQSDLGEAPDRAVGAMMKTRGTLRLSAPPGFNQCTFRRQTFASYDND